MFVFGDAVDVFLFVMGGFIAGVEIDSGAVTAGLDDAAPVGSVLECGVVAALGEVARFVEGGVGEVPAVAVEQIAVGVVGVAGDGDTGLFDGGNGVGLGAAVKVFVAEVGFEFDVADGIVGVTLATHAGKGDAGKAVEGVVGEVLCDILIEVFALGEVAKSVIGIGVVLHAGAAADAGADALHAAQRIVHMQGDDVVTEGFPFHLAVGGGAIGLPVETIVRGVTYLGEVTALVVDFAHGEAGGIGDFAHTAIGVVVTALGIVFIQDGGGGATGPAQAVIAHHLGVAIGGAAHCVEFTCPRSAGTVVGPHAGAFRFHALGHAAQCVVLHGGDLGLSVFLPNELTEGVVGILPLAHVRVVHQRFATANVIAHGGDIARGVGGLAEIAVGVVFVIGAAVEGVY